MLSKWSTSVSDLPDFHTWVQGGRVGGGTAALPVHPTSPNLRVPLTDRGLAGSKRRGRDGLRGGDTEPWGGAVCGASGHRDAQRRRKQINSEMHSQGLNCNMEVE